MASYFFHKQKCSDKFGVGLVRFAFKFKAARERYNFKFKMAFTNNLSKNYSYNKRIDYNIIKVNDVLVEVIHYKKTTPTHALIQLHGGAYVSGYNDTYRKVARKYLETNSSLQIFSLRYSLAPKYPFPKALEEAIDLYKHLLKTGYKPEQIIVAGDSAGGGLALALGLALKQNKFELPKAMITMSAWTDLAGEGDSYQRNCEVDPFFGKGTVPLDKKAYAGDHDYHNPLISPKYGDFSGFSNLLMFVGSHELIESDTLDFRTKIDNATIHNFEGMFHVFPLGFRKMASSREAWRLIRTFIEEQMRS